MSVKVVYNINCTTYIIGPMSWFYKYAVVWVYNLREHILKSDGQYSGSYLVSHIK